MDAEDAGEGEPGLGVGKRGVGARRTTWKPAGVSGGNGGRSGRTYRERGNGLAVSFVGRSHPTIQERSARGAGTMTQSCMGTMECPDLCTEIPDVDGIIDDRAGGRSWRAGGLQRAALASSEACATRSYAGRSRILRSRHRHRRRQTRGRANIRPRVSPSNVHFRGASALLAAVHTGEDVDGYCGSVGTSARLGTNSSQTKGAVPSHRILLLDLG